MVIYSITNKINGKRYIGQTTRLKKRWNRHRTELRHNYHPNSYLQRAWNKYGEKNFLFEVIDDCKSEKHLLEREFYWIKFYESNNENNGYNLSDGGEGGKPSAAGILRIIQAHKGKPLSDQHRKKISESNKGRIISKESREKTSKTLKKRYAEGMIAVVPPPKSGELHPMWGKKHTPEACVKISKARKGRNYQEIFGTERADEIIAKKRIQCRGDGNPFYKHIDMEYVKKQIDNCVYAADIARELKISLPTLYNHFKKAYGITITQYKIASRGRVRCN